MASNFDLAGLGFDNDPELMRMIMQSMGVLQRGFDLQDQANQPFYRAADQAQVEAAKAKREFQTAFDEPQERVPAGEASAARGLSSFAELLSPGKGYGAKGEANVRERNVGLVQKRVERLQLLEKASDETAKRAQQMGDNKLYMQSLKEGEKFAKMAGEIAETVGGLGRIRAEHKGRMAEIRAKMIGDLATQADKFRLDMMKEYGIDTENATPGQLQAIKGAFKAFDAEVQSAIQFQKSKGEGIDADPEGGRDEAKKAIDAASQKLMETLTGVKQERQNLELDMMDTVKDFMSDGISLDEARKELRAQARNGKIRGVEEAIWFNTITEAYKDKDRLLSQIRAIEKDLNTRSNNRYSTPQTIIDQKLKRRQKLVEELRSKYSLDVQAVPYNVEGITVQ